jgi:hypothetical protein
MTIVNERCLIFPTNSEGSIPFRPFATENKKSEKWREEGVESVYPPPPDSRDTAVRLDDDEKGVVSVTTLRHGKQETAIISEQGLY